jgi:hypothetical protein
MDINSGKKGKSNRGYMAKKWTCPFAFFFAFMLLSRFAFFAFILFFVFSRQKAKKTNRKSKINANGQVHFYPHFFPLFDFPLFFFPFFSTFILLLCFLDFADLLFAFSFFAFVALFFKF